MAAAHGAIAFAGIVALAAAPAAASAQQDYRFGAGYNAGAAWFTSLNSGAGAADDIELDLGWLIGLQFEQWLGSGRVGVRLNGALTERPLQIPAGARDVGVWMLDADLMLRFAGADSTRKVNPFLSAGAGVVRYGLGRGDFVNFPEANAAYSGNDKPRFAAVGGLGIDFMTGWRWDGNPVGIRVEGVDHFVLKSPFEPLGGGDFSAIHNVRLVIGLFSGFGDVR
jgi:hypothetical protein